MLLFGFVFAVALHGPRDPATWIHVRLGQKILTERRIPFVEPFSYGAAGANWTTGSWLSEAAFSKLNAWGGPVLISVVKSAVIASAFVLLLPVNHGNPALAGLVLTLGACAASAGFTETPALFDFLFLAIFIRVLRPRGRFRWWTAALAAVATGLWANLHGSAALLALWFMGLKVFKVSLRTAPRERIGYWMTIIACAICFSWNPHGFGLIARAFIDAASTPRVPLASWAGLFVLAGIGASWITLQDEFVTTLVCATVLALALVLPGMRPPAVLAACALLVLALEHWVPARRLTAGQLAFGAVWVFALYGAYFFAVGRANARDSGFGRPALEGAVAFLDENNVGGRMFNEPSLGAELIGSTDRPIFSDLRDGIYSQEFRRGAQDWPRMFRELDDVYHFDYAVVGPDAARARIIAEDKDWVEAYVDGGARVFVRREAGLR